MGKLEGLVELVGGLLCALPTGDRVMSVDICDLCFFFLGLMVLGSTDEVFSPLHATSQAYVPIAEHEG